MARVTTRAPCNVRNARKDVLSMFLTVDNVCAECLVGDRVVALSYVRTDKFCFIQYFLDVLWYYTCICIA